jgi:phage tail sheath gpL-like
MAISTAVDASAVASVVGIKTNFVNLRGGRIVLLPQRVAVVGQGASAATYSTDKRQVTSAYEVGSTYGFGSPLHLAAQQLLPDNGDGLGTIPLTVYPLEDDPSGLTASGDITPSGAVTAAAGYVVRAGGVDSQAFSVEDGDTLAQIVTKITTAINAELDMPVIATDSTTKVDLDVKWAGASGEEVPLSIVGDTDSGISFGITALTGGAVNPDVAPALAQVGDVWETMIVNCFSALDSGALDEYQTFGDGRWGPLTRKPCVVFTGSMYVDPEPITDTRKADRINSVLVAPGSPHMPCVIAARQVARMAVVANNNPPVAYTKLDASGLIPGADGIQWDYVKRDAAVKAGSSTITVEDGVVKLEDIITFYHPDGDPTPAYRYVVDIVKLQNIIFNLNLIFATPEWASAPLIPDGQPTANRAARKPKAAVAAMAAMVDNLGLEAIISDPETAKGTIAAEIDSQNPKRLNAALTVQLSGNPKIISVDLNFGFYFGASAIVA